MRANSPLFRIFAPSVRRWRPGWSFLFSSTVVTQLRGVSRPAWPIPIERLPQYYCLVGSNKDASQRRNHNPFTNSGGQNQLLRNGECEPDFGKKTSAPGFASSMLLTLARIVRQKSPAAGYCDQEHYSKRLPH